MLENGNLVPLQDGAQCQGPSASALPGLNIQEVRPVEADQADGTVQPQAHAGRLPDGR